MVETNVNARRVRGGFDGRSLLNRQRAPAQAEARPEARRTGVASDSTNASRVP